MIIEALILAYYKQGLKIIIETTFFDYIGSGILSQLGKNGQLYSIAFFSKNMNFAKYNYEIYDKNY